MSITPPKSRSYLWLALMPLLATIPLFPLMVMTERYSVWGSFLRTAALCLFFELLLFAPVLYFRTMCRHCGIRRSAPDSQYCSQCDEFLSPSDDDHKYPRFDYDDYLRNAVVERRLLNLFLLCVLLPLIFFFCIMGVAIHIFGPLPPEYAYWGLGLLGLNLIVQIVIASRSARKFACPKCKYPMNSQKERFAEGKTCPKCGLLLFNPPDKEESHEHKD